LKRLHQFGKVHDWPGINQPGPSENINPDTGGLEEASKRPVSTQNGNLGFKLIPRESTGQQSELLGGSPVIEVWDHQENFHRFSA
jgi:hypothetical protein